MECYKTRLYSHVVAYYVLLFTYSHGVASEA